MVRYFWSESNGTNRPTVRYMDFEPSTEYYNGMPLKKNEAGAVMPTTGDPEYICLWDYQPDGDIRTLEIPVIEIFPDTIYEKWNEDGSIEEVRFGSGGGGLPSDLMETVPDEVPLEITWDGDLEGKETVDANGQLLAKISDISDLTVEQLLGATLTVHVNGVDQQTILGSDEAGDLSNDGLEMLVCVAHVEMEDGPTTMPCVYIVYGDVSALGLNLSTGVWFCYLPEMFYVKSLSTPNVLIPGGERTQIKQEFLPKHLQFGEKKTTGPLNITFDGDLTGKETVPIEEGAYFVKVSDNVLSVGDLLGGTLVASTESGKQAIELTTETVMDAGSQGIPAIMIMEEMVLVVYGDVSSTLGMNLSNGVWFAVSGEYYTESISNPNVTITTSEIKKLDNKFIDAEWMAVGGREQFEGEILPKVTWSAPGVGSGDDYAKSGEASNYDLLKKGDLLRVVFDGKPYDMTVREFAANERVAWRYVGNLGGIYPTMEPAPPNTGESFCVVFCTFGLATTEKVFSCDVVVASEEIAHQTHTISIYADSGFVPLPEKFMPDLNQLTMISPSGKKFKVTVDDSGKLTAAEV